MTCHRVELYCQNMTNHRVKFWNFSSPEVYLTTTMQHISGTAYCRAALKLLHRMTKTNLTVTAAEMKFVRKAAQCTLFDHKQYQDILNKLQTVPPLWKINNYNNKWIHPPSRSQVKNVWSYSFSSPNAFMVWPEKPLHCLQHGWEWTDQHLYTIMEHQLAGKVMQDSH